ncbi:hypothetical protein J2X11_001551 [Aeromicrobium panaciterrae]|uniref:Diiron oxygenase n=1 Tax=Aeromicrobium panaciterrae TaxID=363861 RepID=A0ABU1UNF5_9ACTN|nr:diiron oxygenase [Aeromicrobium panaciterrae]MDR7086712.1 hypothetical protein [Aeromicrobium panaciterrae]
MTQTLENPTELSATRSREEYAEVLHGLSVASTEHHFDAFIDIPWEHPDFQIDRTDPRWILPANVDPLGAHPWYQAQSVERQIEIGLWRQANILRVGVQFENILIRGIMQYCFELKNQSPEFRYLMHEATEECHHNQMFQEAINRIGVDAPGMPWLMRRISWAIPGAASTFPVSFFIGVLAGEEPIDHTQKGILRGGKDLPPLMSRIMEIHVAEEARHISFAHEFIKIHGPNLGRINKFIVSLLFPLIMRTGADLIMIPPKAFRKEFGIPRKVIKELYWKAPESRVRLQDMFADARMLAEQSGLMTRTSRRMWRLLKIDGRSSRFRSEPSVAFLES